MASWVKEQHRVNGQGGLATARPSSIQSMASIYAETAANAMLVLIGVACALLERQIEAQAAAFTAEGGFTERLHRIRSERRRVGS